MSESINKSIYLGNLTPVLQGKFLTYFKEAEKNFVPPEQFVSAWNMYATSIEEHIFLVESVTTAADDYIGGITETGHEFRIQDLGDK